MGDMASSSRAFLDFDFSAFIDNSFDTSSELFNTSVALHSPTVLSPATTPALDDFLSQSDTGSVGSHTVPSNMSILHSSQQNSYCTYENASPDISAALLLQNNLLSFQNHKIPPSLSCIDTFIQNPDSDLVQLVQQNKDEFHVFQNLISNSFSHHLSVTLPEKSQNQKKRKSPAAVQNPSPNKKAYTKGFQEYENSDDVNAQLLRELIKQTTNKRNHQDFVVPMEYSPPKEMPPQFALSKNVSAVGQEQQLYHARRYGGGSNPDSQIPNSKRHNVPPVPYHIQTTVAKKSTKNKVYHRRPSNNINNRPPMYSSDINPAQLLEIQAISRAQQDFIRAREQQEAEKELFLKLQKKA
ncbi:hypothetical protein K501DRAFT_273124 [Backusella circina FSU 941]|nr:hypothetical protein K501DRAFT_273124 [Backusella circina FSU 941]